jgi:AraC-like DNA-binding protein
VEILRYFIFFYCFLGVFIAGGLFFKKRNPPNITLALFIVLFTLEQLDFLYTTSEIVHLYPQYFLIIYPVCLLFGPSLWLHFRYIKDPELKFRYWHLLHSIPFILFVSIFLLPVFQFDGPERIIYARDNFMNYFMPLNYIRTSHVSIYGILMVFVIVRDRLYRKNSQGIYLTIIAIIYLLTAVLQQYLTMFAENYGQFALYFFLASTIVLIAGFVLYAYPNILQEFQQKYFSSTLNTTDRERIIAKLNESRTDRDIFLNSKLNLNYFCEQIGERPQYVSQVLSEDFSTSFSGFVNTIRVDYASQILLDPSKDHLKILAVAFESGFNNNVTFNKAFVKFKGVTPGKFRKERSQ